MPHIAAFHLGLHCLQNHQFMDIQSTIGVNICTSLLTEMELNLLTTIAELQTAPSLTLVDPSICMYLLFCENRYIATYAW